jgi:tripartite ATP-independent transporter DctP family solute receptor
LPYAFTSYEHVYRVQDGPVGKEIAKRVLDKTGVRYLAYGNIGFRHTLTVAKPVRTPADFVGLKIRVPPSPAFVNAFKLLGANPTPIPGGEMYTALKTGVVDGVEGAPDILLDFKMFEVAKNYSLTGHIYTDIPLVIADRLWQKMTPDRQKAFMEAARAAELYERELIKQGESATFDTLRKSGVTIVNVDTAPMRAKMTPYYDEFAKRIGGPALITQTLDAAK